MSRFGECYEEPGEEELNEYLQELNEKYKQDLPELKGFFEYLDRMPVKRIISEHLISARKPGNKCAIGTFCEYKGIPNKRLWQVENACKEMKERGGEYGEEGKSPTVDIGSEAGLCREVAYDIAWHNDKHWDYVYDENIATRKKMSAEERWRELRAFISQRISAAEKVLEDCMIDPKEID